MSNDRLSGRHVLVTGAGGGIGLAIAQACLAQGARCTLVDRAVQSSEGVRGLQHEHPNRVVYLPADVTDLPSITPGAMALTRIPCGAIASAALCV